MYERAASTIRKAEAFIITAGAGMGVDIFASIPASRLSDRLTYRYQLGRSKDYAVLMSWFHKIVVMWDKRAGIWMSEDWQRTNICTSCLGYEKSKPHQEGNSMSAKARQVRRSETPKHPLIRHYVEALHRFRDDLKLHSELFEELPTFSSVVQHNKQLSQLITECQSYLLECDNGALPSDFKDMLKEEYAEVLEDLLNYPPSPVPKQLQDDDQDELLSDLDEFFQRVYERTIQNDGFKLYHVLIGAA